MLVRDLDVATLNARSRDEGRQIDSYERQTADVEYFADRKPVITVTLVATDVLELLRLSEGASDCESIASTPWLDPIAAEQGSTEVDAIRAERRIVDTPHEP